MSPLSPVAPEIARKNMTVALKAFSSTGIQSQVAAVMGVSEATISRHKNDHLETLCQMLAYAGVKLVSVDTVCVDRSAYELMLYVVRKAMLSDDISKRLICEDE